MTDGLERVSQRLPLACPVDAELRFRRCPRAARRRPSFARSPRLKNVLRRAVHRAQRVQLHVTVPSVASRRHGRPFQIWSDRKRASPSRAPKRRQLRVQFRTGACDPFQRITVQSANRAGVRSRHFADQPDRHVRLRSHRHSVRNDDAPTIVRSESGFLDDVAYTDTAGRKSGTRAANDGWSAIGRRMQMRKP